MKNHRVDVLGPPRIISQFPSAVPAESQCDACSPIVSAKNGTDSLNKPSSTYRKDPAVILQPIDSTHYAAVSPLSEAFSVLNGSAKRLLEHFNSARNPEDVSSAWHQMWGEGVTLQTCRQMAMLGLLTPKGNTKPELTEVPNVLAAWLHVTDRCNLRCSYCYLPHDKTDMSVQTGQAAIDAIFRSALAHNYKCVKLKYAGGEPLLRFPVVRKLQQYAREQADKHNRVLDGIVLSNGTLLGRSIVKTMQALGLRLMISLDGFGEFQDCQRYYADGRGSAGDVAAAVDLSLEYGLVPDISITVTARNVKGLPGIVAWALGKGLPFSLNLYRKNDLSLCHPDLELTDEEIVDGMLAAYDVIRANLPNRSLLASLLDRVNLSCARLRTCSVGHSYVVFDSLGQVSKCQMQMDKPVTTVQAEDPLTLVRKDTAGIQNVRVDEKEGCRSCEWEYWCTGGCSLNAFRATGRYDVKSPHCGIYKVLCAEVLRLEGLRLMKYASSS